MAYEPSLSPRIILITLGIIFVIAFFVLLFIAFTTSNRATKSETNLVVVGGGVATIPTVNFTNVSIVSSSGFWADTGDYTVTFQPSAEQTWTMQGAKIFNTSTGRYLAVVDGIVVLSTHFDNWVYTGTNFLYALTTDMFNKSVLVDDGSGLKLVTYPFTEVVNGNIKAL